MTAQGSSRRARVTAPDMLERGRANVLTCPVYSAATLSVPSSATITIRSAGGGIEVDAAAATITSSVATYSYTPAATLALGEGWVVEWTLTYADEVLVVRNDACLCRVRLACPVALGDIYTVAPALNPDGAAPVSSSSEGDQDQLLQVAWGDTLRWLISAGHRPWLLMGAGPLVPLVRTHAAALIWRTLAQRSPSAHGPEADRLDEAVRQERASLRLVVDDDDNGVPDARRAAKPTVLWLGGPPPPSGVSRWP